VTAGGSGGGAWSFGYSYDRFGNMWASSSSGLTLHFATPRAQDQFNAATNRLTKAFDGTALSNPYDAAGNLQNHPYVGAMQYDAESRQTQFTSGSTTVTYHYDGDGRRVKQVKGSETTVFVYDAFGNLAADYSTAQATGTAKKVGDRLRLSRDSQ
jgi:YD repeat-containing protein